MVLKKLGRYDIIGVLGKGAMGLVYEARDPNLDRRVAIKTIKVDNLSQKAADEYAMRFRTEARSAARLQHPNIVSVYDSDRHHDVAYLVMEFVQGEDLKQHIDNGRVFTLEQSLHMMRDLLAALEYAHVRHVIHRDVKPANLMVEANGRVKLTDFGVARMQDSGEGTRTRGSMVGTLKYMSPEQVQGQLVDARADIFAAGVVLYQLLTGRRPFDGDSEFAIIQQIIATTPPAPSSLNPLLPAALDDVVALALAKSRDERFASAQAFAVALRAAGGLVQDQTIALPTGTAGGVAFAGTGSQAQPSRVGGSTVRLAMQADGSYSTVTQELELVYWKDVKDSDDKQDLLGFLDRFPTGVYADLARRRLRRWGNGGVGDQSASRSGSAAWPSAKPPVQGDATLLSNEETLLLARERAAPRPAPAATTTAAPSPVPVPAPVLSSDTAAVPDVGKHVDDVGVGPVSADLAGAGADAGKIAHSAAAAASEADEAAAAVAGDGRDSVAIGAGLGAYEGAGSDSLAGAVLTDDMDAGQALRPDVGGGIGEEGIAPAADEQPEVGDTKAIGDGVAPADEPDAPSLPLDDLATPDAPLGHPVPVQEYVAPSPPAKSSSRNLLLAVAGVAVLSIAAVLFLRPSDSDSTVPVALPQAAVAGSVATESSAPMVAVPADVLPAVAPPAAALAASAASAPGSGKSAVVTPVEKAAPAKSVVAKPAPVQPAAGPSTAATAAVAAVPPPAPVPTVPAPASRKPAIAKAGASDIAPSPLPPSPAGPEAACDGRVLLGYQSCMSEQCTKPMFFEHATCVQRRQAEQARKAQQLNRN